jgi:hypothetical protein
MSYLDHPDASFVGGSGSMLCDVRIASDQNRNKDRIEVPRKISGVEQ